MEGRMADAQVAMGGYFIYGPNEELTLSEQELERNGRNLWTFGA